MKGLWINVKDRLPEDKQMVLVLSKYYSHKYESWSWDIRCVMYITDYGMNVHERSICREKITHWMPVEVPDQYKI